MYAHPSFVRDTPETLLQLRKITSGGARKQRPTTEVSVKYNSRTVSPLSPSHHSQAEPASPVSYMPKIIVPRVAHWGSTTAYTSATPILPRATDRGKLDLLAMAMEHQAAH